MRAIKSSAVVLIVALAGIWAWPGDSNAQRLPGAAACNMGASTKEAPLVEFRDAHFGPSGETCTLLTIDRTGLARLIEQCS